MTDQRSQAEIVRQSLKRRYRKEWRFRAYGMAAIAIALSADRKSTRLNSSHVRISYAVFCLKKKMLMITPPSRAIRYGPAALVTVKVRSSSLRCVQRQSPPVLSANGPTLGADA